jgi:hypothetical protein
VSYNPWQFYEDIYAALYETNLRSWSGAELNAALATTFGLAIAIMMNCGFLLTVVTAMRGTVRWPEDSVLVYGIPASCLLVNCAAFLYRGRYRYVVARFRGEAAPYRRRMTVLAWMYIIFSVVSLFAVLILMAHLAKQI